MLLSANKKCNNCNYLSFSACVHAAGNFWGRQRTSATPVDGTTLISPKEIISEHKGPRPRPTRVYRGNCRHVTRRGHTPTSEDIT
jgi:hypothetical protein